jgi:hypothetical protein
MTALPVIIVLLSIGIISDFILALHGGFQATISWWIWTNSVKYPIIPFAIGVLMGHLFWNQSLNVLVQGGCSQ